MNVKKKTQSKKTLEPGKVRVYNPVTDSYYIFRKATILKQRDTAPLFKNLYKNASS